MRRLVPLALVALLVAACGSGQKSVRSTGGRGVTRWISAERLPKAAWPGARLFATAGCTTCHTYAGSGQTALDAPDLTSIGSRHLGIAFQVAHLKCPACVNPGAPMPPFRDLGAKHLHELAIFLEASKGVR
jgi:cytochrome c oxidase subunit 2